jgi:translation initiation factor 5
MARTDKGIISFFATQLGTGWNKSKFNRIVDTNTLEDLLEIYIERYVLCKSCFNPETHLNKKILSCSACGHSIKVDNIKYY